jgi:hypothetical protein
MVSDFAVAHCGQVMTDSRIIVLPKACPNLQLTTLLAVKAKSNQPGAEDQRRNERITSLGKPGGQLNRAGRSDHRRRGTTDRCNHRKRASRNEISVAHGAQLFGAEG